MSSTTKIGVQNLNHSVNEEIYTYRSTLLPAESDDALLSLLWRYKGRIDSYTVSCLQSLVNLLALDENIADHFS